MSLFSVTTSMAEKRLLRSRSRNICRLSRKSQDSGNKNKTRLKHRDRNRASPPGSSSRSVWLGKSQKRSPSSYTPRTRRASASTALSPPSWPPAAEGGVVNACP